MSNAVAHLKSGGDVSAIVPQDTNDVRNLAVMIAQSGMAPKGMERPETIAVAIIAGMEAGLTPMESVNSIAVINGRPSMWGDAVLGLVMGSGLVEDISEDFRGQGDQLEAVCTVKRKNLGSATVRTFSVQDAQTAGLWGKQGPWRQYPKRMLQLRARSFALRDAFPDVLHGIHVREEVRDYQDFGVRTQQTTNPVSVAEIAGNSSKEEQPDETIEDAEVVETLSTDRAQEILKAVANVTNGQEYSAVIPAIVEELKPLADTPLKARIGEALKAKRAELKSASQKQTQPGEDLFPGDLPEGQSMADE